MSSLPEKKAAARSFAEKLKAAENPDVFYSHLYTNQDASAIETDEDEVASGLLKRRRERQTIAEIHGAEPPSNKDSALVNLIKLDTALLKINRKILEVELAKRPQGYVYGWNFTINTTPLVHIDFLDTAFNAGIPTGTAINTPGFKLFTLTIWNDAGADVGFSINREITNASDEAILKAGNFYTVEFDEAKISNVNLAIIGGASADIRMIGVA